MCDDFNIVKPKVQIHLFLHLPHLELASRGTLILENFGSITNLISIWKTGYCTELKKRSEQKTSKQRARPYERHFETKLLMHGAIKKQ